MKGFILYRSDVAAAICSELTRAGLLGNVALIRSDNTSDLASYETSGVEIICVDADCVGANTSDIIARLGWKMHFDLILDVVSGGADARLHIAVKGGSAIAGALCDEVFLERLDVDRLVRILTDKFRGYDLESAENKLIDVLAKIGIYSNRKGYRQIICAFRESFKNIEILNGNVMEKLYPRIAAQCGTNAACVEKNIRQAIESSVNSEKFYHVANAELGGNFTRYDKPSNSEFIAFLVDRIPRLVRTNNI